MSFLKDIEKLAQPVFQLPDLEDEDVDGTSSKAVSKTKSEDDNGVSNLRRRVIALDVDDSSKYGGTKVSRNEIFDDFSGMTGLSDHPATENGHDDQSDVEDDADEDDDESGEDELNGVEKHNDDRDDEDESGDEASPTTSSVDGESDEGESGSEEDVEEQHEEQADGDAKAVTMQDLMKKVDQDKQKRKGESVRAQSEIWEQLLYVKIKLHAALTAFNQLPRGQLAKDLLKEADEETVKNLKQAQKNALKLVSGLLEAENLLLSLSSFTQAMNGEEGGAVDSDDEEIESSEDEKDGSGAAEASEDDEEEENGSMSAPQAHSVNIKSLSKRLCESEEKFTKFRNATLVKWDERTKLISSRRTRNANSDFSAFEKENIVAQIEKICSDRPRVLKRSRTKKSDVERIGGNAEVAEEDEEIYDDDDFYQVLLKELIDKKTSNTQDPVAMTRHYIEMQKLKSKRSKKKYVDHRASKDRKIKYLPIPKLVNFHPAMPEMVEWSHESRNELFKSLFS